MLSVSEHKEAPEYKEVIDRAQLIKILERPKTLRRIADLLHLDIRETYINLHYLVNKGVIRIITPTETKEIFYTLLKEVKITVHHVDAHLTPE